MEVVSLHLEEALELNATGLFQLRLFVICGLAFMTDSLGVNLLSFLTTCAAAEWKLSNSAQAVLTSVVFVGMVAGSIFWGRFADEFGRKRTLLYSCLMVTIGGFASAIAPSYAWLVLFRAVAGFGIGGASIPFDLLAEFLSASARSCFLVYMGIFWTLGSMFVAGMAWIVLPLLGWRFLAFVTTVPVLLTTALAYMYLPESPRWLLSKGLEAEAIRIIREAALVNGHTMPEFTLTASIHDNADVKEGSYRDLVSTKAARRITFPLWAIWALFGFTYYGIILFVSRVYSNQDEISTSEVPKCEFNYAAIFYNAAAEIVSVVISAGLIERLGRVRSQSVFYVIGGLGVILMGLQISPGAVLFFSIVARMGVNSALVATWVVTPELFSTETRTMGHSSCTAVSRIGSFLASFVVISSLNYTAVGCILGVLNILAAVAAHFLPETSGKSLDEVNADTLHTLHKSESSEYALLDSPTHHNHLHVGHSYTQSISHSGSQTVVLDDEQVSPVEHAVELMPIKTVHSVLHQKPHKVKQGHV